ncbi:hypothetical protein HanXRQr2_Chr10g0466181 [Helianthus annuus]|uniref:Uncharacterized protein n=1 Tax=Helianthus annuus TaxID=4232 RepID=A0A9K3I267_HELAN|nr:uncharacterized protein LOC110887006 [Helianthus annuus]KAF5788635.1 hypothetical protein HanXRQr2_Chr10g0466181 [Helianthus annuus]KAJ0885863.1 hypothetical protein HanPSC8_Chr10g0449891 [Helianthus annuus]
MSMSMSMALEALAINYLTHTVWAWIAFLTAALSFWKIKPSPSPLPPPAHPISTSTSPPPPLSDDEPDPDDQQEVPSSSTTIFCSLENRRSGKFRVYYDGIAVAARTRRPIKGSVHNPQRLVLGDHGWEALLKLKTAEMGWYRYQDLTMLDGSVVQLWN